MPEWRWNPFFWFDPWFYSLTSYQQWTIRWGAVLVLMVWLMRNRMDKGLRG